MLAGRLEAPRDGESRAVALFAHCFTCTKNLRAVGDISRALNGHGITVLRFDFTGLGESEGDFADTNFSSNVDDLVAAADYLGREHRAPQLLVGHSLGGAAVIQAAARIESVRAVATIAAPADPGHIRALLRSSEEEIERRGEAEVELAGRRFTIRAQFLRDLEEQTMRATIGSLDRALAILHSPLDRIVGVENAAEIFRAARHPKSFISLDSADHLLSKRDDSRYAGAVIGAWVERYLSAP
jgi:alpha-beta hydrolase superfamily lysophospholipase